MNSDNKQKKIKITGNPNNYAFNVLVFFCYNQQSAKALSYFNKFHPDTDF